MINLDTKTGTHKIDTGNARPICESLRRFSPWQIDEIIRQIQEMVGMKVATQCESEWSSNIVLVRKKTKDIRLCLDWRKLNDVTKKIVYPVPNIQSLLDGYCGSKYYTSLDLASRYWQIDLEESSKDKTVF